MAQTDSNKAQLESHTELQQKKDDPDEVKEEMTEQQLIASIDYNMEDDAMHVEFNESQWLSCIPGVSLTLATIIFAVIGAAVGITIAVVNAPQTKTEEIMTRWVNVTGEELDTDFSYATHTIRNVYDVNGTIFVDYTMQEEYTTIVDGEMETLSDEWAKLIAFPGTLWVNALKLLVLPLIVLMMVVLPSRVDEIGFIGKRAIPLYLFTSSMAAIQGTIWAWIIQPGAHGDKPDLGTRSNDSGPISELDAFLNIFTQNLVPSNIVSAMGNLTILGVIVFFLTIGILLRRPTVKEAERTVVLNFSKAILRCCMMAVVWIVWFTPIGMGSLVCIKIASTENLVDLLAALGLYVLTVLIGHSIHLFVFYPAVFFATTRGNGWKWFAKIYEAPLLAFATSSSAATLPRSLQVAYKAGVRKSIFQFILPLGAAINMDGTALGFPIMIALIAQLNNVQLDAGTVFIVMILSVVVSVGTAPIPNAGMVYLTMLFETAGMGDLAGEGLATLFVLDWFVDRIETAVNVTSDQFVAKIIDDVSLLADKKHANIVLGCCLRSKGPDEEQEYEQAARSTPSAEKAEDNI